MITLADAKLNLRVDSSVSVEDTLVERLIDSATGYLERRTGWHLGAPGERTLVVCGAGTRTLWLPQPPVSESVTVTDDGDPVEDYEVRGSRLVRTDGVWVYGLEYAVTYDAGYETGTGPPDLQQAVRLIVAGWYEHREAWATGTIVADHRHSVDQIVGAYERVRT